MTPQAQLGKAKKYYVINDVGIWYFLQIFSFFFHQSDGVSLARPNAFAKMADPVKTMTDIFLQMTPNSTKILNK